MDIEKPSEVKKKSSGEIKIVPAGDEGDYIVAERRSPPTAEELARSMGASPLPSHKQVAVPSPGKGPRMLQDRSTESSPVSPLKKLLGVASPPVVDVRESGKEVERGEFVIEEPDKESAGESPVRYSESYEGVVGAESSTGFDLKERVEGLNDRGEEDVPGGKEPPQPARKPGKRTPALHYSRGGGDSIKPI